MFLSGKPFQPSLMFVGKARSLASLGQAPAKLTTKGYAGKFFQAQTV
jgi:hypothetical protein